MTERPTVLDVLDNVLGGTHPALAAKMGEETVEELAYQVERFYDLWKPEEQQISELVVYSGGSLGMVEPGIPATSYLYSSLLYYPRIVVNCPFGEWFTRDAASLTLDKFPPRLRPEQLWPSVLEYTLDNQYRPHTTPIEEAREAVVNKLSIVHAIRPLIEAGIVMLVPPWKLVRRRQHQIAGAMRRDLNDEQWFTELNGDGPEFCAAISDHVDATPPISGHMTRAQVRWQRTQPASFYLNKLLAIAAETGSIYIPRDIRGQQLLDLRTDSYVRELRRRTRTDLQVVRGLATVELPMFQGLEPANLVALRKDDDAFSDFRDALSGVFRIMPVDESSTEYPAEVRAALQDILGPHERSLRRLTNKSPLLRAAALEGMLQIGLARLGGSPSIPAILGAGLIPPIVAWLQRPRPSGVALAIQALTETKRR